LSESDILEKANVTMDSTNSGLDEESLTDCEDEKYEPEKSPCSVINRLKFGTSTIVELAFSSSLWEAEEYATRLL
jgi:hypothetical protein